MVLQFPTDIGGIGKFVIEFAGGMCYARNVSIRIKWTGVAREHCSAAESLGDFKSALGCRAARFFGVSRSVFMYANHKSNLRR